MFASVMVRGGGVLVEKDSMVCLVRGTVCGGGRGGRAHVGTAMATTVAAATMAAQAPITANCEDEGGLAALLSR